MLWESEQSSVTALRSSNGKQQTTTTAKEGRKSCPPRFFPSDLPVHLAAREGKNTSNVGRELCFYLENMQVSVLLLFCCSKQKLYLLHLEVLIKDNIFPVRAGIVRDERILYVHQAVKWRYCTHCFVKNSFKDQKSHLKTFKLHLY